MNVNEAFNVLNLSGSEFSKDEIKAAYRIAMSKYHPDRAKDEKENKVFTELAKAINAAYNYLSSLGEKVKANFTDYSNQEDFYNYTEELQEALNKLYEMQGVIFEVCGNWIWISGNTKEYKNEIGKNGLGCFWASKKKMWYYRPEEHKSRNKGKTSTMDEIRAKYGSSGHQGGNFGMIKA